jgi:septal ring factor EnvC (AmiA/AmiB activator)
MNWLWTRRFSTRDLVRADYEPPARRGVRPLIWVASVIALAALVVLALAQPDRHSAGMQADSAIEMLRQENRRLRDTLAQNNLKMQQDQAAREELERELAKSSATIKQLQDRLIFYRQQTGK